MRNSFERIGDDVRGGPARRTRSSIRDRDTANIAHAIETDETGVVAPSGHLAFTVCTIGDDPHAQIAIAYNTEITEYGNVTLPKNTSEALNGPQSEEWRAAYARDLEAKMQNETFVYVPRPPNRTKVVKTKVAHAVKRDEKTNAITELRARWVGMGFLQGPGDFSETYTATPTATSVRVFLNMTLALGLELAQGDVTKAFTLNPIDVKLHVEQMPGMEVAGDWPGATKANTVCLLLKCLEGLKQAGNVWQRTHTAKLLDTRLTRYLFRFTQSTIEPCLFILHCSQGILLILVWVDDILVAFSGRSLYDDFVLKYSAVFPSKHHLGCNKFAGVAVDYKPGKSLQIDQRAHIELAYDKFIADKPAALKSPAASRPAIADRDSPRHYSKLALAKDDHERSAMRSKPFLPALATLMYIAFWTYPHIMYHCSFLGQFMHYPGLNAYFAVLDLIIYCYRNKDIDVIVYTIGHYTMPRCIPESKRTFFNNCFGAHAFCDASWLLRSVSGYVIMMCNGPVDWSSKLIRVICHSSSEAEIASGCFSGKRTVFLVQLLGEFGVKFGGKMIMLIDNTAAMDLSQKLGVQTRTAHFLRWQHYLRWLVLHQYVELYFVPTKEQLADIFTKVLDMSTYLAFCSILFQHRKLRSP